MEPLVTPNNLQSLPTGQAGQPTQAGNNHSLQLTKEQKIGLAVLGCFTLLIIIFWFVELNRNITYPFYGGMSKDDFAKKVASENGTPEQIAAATATADARDTDGDGLTDTQELTIYKTSPFLSDTDSDGISDGQEVKNGTNPNCPEGKQCSADGMVIGTEQVSANGTTTADLFNSGVADSSNISNNIVAPLNSAPTQSLDATSASTLKQAFGVNPDPKYLREQLIQAATKQADKDSLQKLSDADLLQLYNSMITQQ